MSELRRERERRLTVSPERPRQIVHGGSVFVGKVITAQSAIAAGKFLTVTPNDVSGIETEGGPGTLTATGGAPQPVLLLRGTPKTGDYLICEWADFRWVTEVKTGVTCPVNISISNCFPAQTGTWQLKLTGSPTGGTFRLFASGQLTAPIAYGASASDVQTALANLSSVGAGNVTCTGGPLPGSPITVTSTVPGLTLTVGASSLTGGTVPAVVVSVVPGNVPPGATATLTSDESQIITITGHPTGGTFTLSWGGSTATLPYNATQAQIAAALVTQPSIGTGNLVGGPAVFRGVTGAVVTFQGALARANQPLITANASFTGDPNATVTVSELLAGGQVLGPVSIDDQTGKAAFTSVPDGQWEMDIDAPDYVTLTQILPVSCESGTGLSGGGLMNPVDGKIVTAGNPTPVSAPSTATLSGDPAGCTSLNLVSCTGGTASYVGTGGPQTIVVGANTWVRQSWFVATFGCSETLSIVWKMIDNGASLCGIAANIDSIIASCLPGGNPGNGTCTFCSCSAIWWSTSGVGGQIPCGPCPNPSTPCAPASPSIASLAGGGCFGATMVTPWSGDITAPPVPGYAGVAVPLQVGTLWGFPSPGLSSIPCITASI